MTKIKAQYYILVIPTRRIIIQNYLIGIYINLCLE